ncbi:MAG: hypothetical protein WDN72_07440 [Alphaproteobacteria bacterium]
MTLKATEVFVPGAYPEHTYVERAEQKLEETLKNALDTPGQIISLSGPSKSGKTVLVEKVVGQEQLIAISGASLKRPEDVWQHVLDWMDLPTSVSSSTTIDGNIKGTASASVGAGILGFVKGTGSLSATAEAGGSVKTEQTQERGGLLQVQREIANSPFVVLIDDFHYMDRTLQVEVAKILKEGVRLNIKIVTASVSHRNDDVVRANPELRGRVKTIDLKYWSKQELEAIAKAGFGILNIGIAQEVINQFVIESAGSPQLMQLLCLQACFALSANQKSLPFKDIEISSDKLKQILEQASTNTNYRSLIDVLDSGPRLRGTERKTYNCYDNTSGDVYRVVLKAVAMNPPRLSFPYEELLRRTAKICVGESPVGSSVTSTCLHMSKLAQEKFPAERAIDWDEQKQVFDIPDPYLLFYLRWSGRLLEE